MTPSIKKWIKYIAIAIPSLFFWYISIPALGIWYIWKKTSFTSKNKWIVSAIIVAVGFSIIPIIFFSNDSTETAKNPNTPEKIEKVLTPEEKATQEVEAIQKQKDSLTNNIEFLKNYKPAMPRDEVGVIEAEVTVWSAYSDSIAKAKMSEDPEIKKLGSELEAAVKAMQVKEFPKIRKAYAELMDKKLWVEDINAEAKGSGNTILTITGAIFAANKNALDFETTIHDMLKFLRFKKVEYRWYEGGSGSAFDIESKPDTDIDSL